MRARLTNEQAYRELQAKYSEGDETNQRSQTEVGENEDADESTGKPAESPSDTADSGGASVLDPSRYRLAGSSEVEGLTSEESQGPKRKRRRNDAGTPSPRREEGETKLFSVQEMISPQEAWGLSNKEAMEFLMNMWDLNAPIIQGVLSIWGDNIELWELSHPHNREGFRISYPVKGLSGKRAHLIYAGANLKYEEGEIVEAEFVMSEESERKKNENPLGIKLKNETIEPLKKIPESFTHTSPDGGLLVEDSLFSFLKSRVSPQVFDQVDKEKEKLENLKDKKAHIEKKVEEKSKEVESFKKTISNLEDKKNEAYRARNQARQERDEARKQKEHEIKSLEREKETRREQLMNEVEKLNQWVEDRADRLRRLDLISDSMHREVVDSDRLDTDPDNVPLDFSDDLDGDYAKLLDHVHGYLYREKDLLYPRSLIENFLTLLQTHDLIVFAGLSGSGKTQLVRSVGKAVGAKSHVIPVKPNWTSAEDLLGYYNPLERTYKDTKFLNALIEAEKDPNRLHFICLDEMNLARVEYYFADFLSKLENRDEDEEQKLDLYSSQEASHVRSEFRILMDVIDKVDLEDHQGFGELLSDEEVNQRLRDQLGIEEGTSLVELHSHLRRMLAGVLRIPADLTIPDNVRFIGTVNMDQTTKSLTPKVLDRAHVVKFRSPMTYNRKGIKDDVENSLIDIPRRVHVPSSQFSKREEYPPYDPDNYIIQHKLAEWANKYLRPMDVDIGLRTLRQAANYREKLSRIRSRSAESEELRGRVLNRILLQKVLPRFSFDGSQPVFLDDHDDWDGSVNIDDRHSLVKCFQSKVKDTLENYLPEDERPPDAAKHLKRLYQEAEEAPGTVYSYWK